MTHRRFVLRSLSGAFVAGAATVAGLPLAAIAQGTAGSGTSSGAKGAGSASAAGAGAGTGATAGTGTPASNAPKLEESDPAAVALSYKHDTTKVDKTKYPNHQASQVCSGCQFYQGTAKNSWAPCTLFGGKQVAANGWCNAYVKKTAAQ